MLSFRTPQFRVSTLANGKVLMLRPASVLVEGLVSSSDFTLNGEKANLANIARSIHVNVQGPAPTFEQITADSPLSIPLGGAFTAAALRQSR
jgi:hypothetical protein